jgi:hypothetical protein
MRQGAQVSAAETKKAPNSQKYGKVFESAGDKTKDTVMWDPVIWLAAGGRDMAAILGMPR